MDNSSFGVVYRNNALERISPQYFNVFLSLPPPAGIIRTALANMDREAREHYTVVIQAKDMAGQVGGLSGSTTINITLTDINDNPPKFPQSTFTTSPGKAEKLWLCFTVCCFTVCCLC